jgi:hypothetical protein
MLTLMEGPQAAADRARLSTLGPKDKYLALTKAHYDNIRANITYSRLDSRGRGRVGLAAELPSSTPPAAGPRPPRSTIPRPSTSSRINPDGQGSPSSRPRRFSSRSPLTDISTVEAAFASK